MSQIDDLQQAVDTLQAQMADVLNQQRFPIGTVLCYAGTNIPPGFLPADGQIVDPKQPELAALAAVLGSTFRLADDPEGTCRVPNLTGRVVRGAKEAGDVGSYTGQDSYSLAIQQIPQHRHGVVGAWHATGADAGRNIGGGGDYHAQGLSGGSGLGTWYEYQGTYTTLEPPAPQQPISAVQASCNLRIIVKF